MGITETAKPPRLEATPLDVIRSRTVHTVTGPSDSVYKIRIPGIGTLLEHDQLPHHLVSIALLDISHRKGAADALRSMMDDVLDENRRGEILAEVKKLGEYQRRLVVAAVVDPELSYEDVASGDLPEDDLSMIAEIVQRVRAFDARGVRIGVEPLDRWAMFHNEHGFDTPGDRCEHCVRLAAAFSSVHVGDL